MSTRHITLVVACIVLAVGAFLLATTDTHADERNCGSALLPRDTTNLGLDTGNVAVDDFSVEEVADDCNQAILRQRYLLVLSGAGSIAAGVWAGRTRRRGAPVSRAPIR
jgi:hypothetical protein